MNQEEKLKELMANEEFVKNLLEMETPEEVSSAFEKEGISITAEEITQVKEKLLEQKNEGELSEDELEEVAGGILGVLIYGIATAVTQGAIWGGTALAAIGIGEKVSGRRW